jgi:hypothetical protein
LLLGLIATFAGVPASASWLHVGAQFLVVMHLREPAGDT